MDNISDTMVSVCLITYNHEPFIRQAIEGVLMQHRNFSFELVIGEDFSSDSTRKICEEYAEKYQEIIKLLPSERNIGMGPNFRRVMQVCTGKYIAICEGDDFWTDPYKLKKQVAFMEENANCSACFTNAEIINEIDNSKRIYLNGLKEGYVPAKNAILRGGALYPTASIVFRKDLYMFETNQEIHELAGDTLLIITMSMQGDVYFLDQITCVYRVWAGGVYSSTMNDSEKTLARKKRTIVGLKKLLKISKKPFRKYFRKRISIESLFVLENCSLIKNIHYMINLNVKDAIRLIIYKIDQSRSFHFNI